MAEEIRGLSVKFDADFSEFKKGMKEADKDINSTQRQLKNLQSSLKIDFDAKKFTQAQQQAQKALDATSQKADLLRQRLEEMESAGVTDKTRDEYNYLQEQLAKTELSAQQLQKQLEELDRIRLDNLTKGIDEVTNKADKASKATQGLSLVAGGLATSLFAAGLNAVSAADEIATLATQYGLSATELQRFQYVALQTDTEADSLYKAFVKVRAGMADIASGATSTAGTALQQLGVNFSRFEGTEKQFYAIVDALSKMKDETQMVAIANDIFGDKLANNLLPMIKAGTGAINEYRAEFETLGALSDSQVAALSDFDNELNQLKTEFANTALQLGSDLLPLMKEFAGIFKDDILPAVKSVFEWFGNLSPQTQSLIVKMLLLTAALSPMLKIFSGITGIVSKVIQWFGKLEKSTLSLYGKWALLLAAVGTLFYVLANWSKMNPVQQIIALFGALSAVALAAAVAFGVFHSAWSLGLAVAGIVAGIAAAIAAVNSAADDINADVNFDAGAYSSAVTGGGEIPSYDVPSYSTSGSSGDTYTNNSSNDTYNVTIVVEGSNQSADEIAEAVSKKIATLSQSRR